MLIYGPFMKDGAHTRAGNAAFDASLREENAAWGLRDLAEVAAAARQAGFAPPKVVAMPANNTTLVLRR